MDQMSDFFEDHQRKFEERERAKADKVKEEKRIEREWIQERYTPGPNIQGPFSLGPYIGGQYHQLWICNNCFCLVAHQSVHAHWDFDMDFVTEIKDAIDTIPKGKG